MQDFEHTKALRQRITKNLQGFERASPAAYVTGDLSGDTSLTSAAVVLAVSKLTASSDAGIYLTLRSSKLRKHAGQFALPGGKLDANESEQQAALRELSEELGISIDVSQIIGLLDDFPTRSGFAITPVVVWNDTDHTPDPNPDEVAQVHEIPLAELIAPDLISLQQTDTTPILSMHPPSVGTTVYSPTAAIIYQFAQVALLGLDTRVAHYEQPDWAWR